MVLTSTPSPALAQSLVSSEGRGALLNLAQLDLSSFRIPDSLGRIVDTWQPAGRIPKAFVVHLQDLHADPSAQRHQSELIGYLRGELGIELVAVEGAKGLLDTTLYSDFPDPQVNERISRLFVEEGLFTGAEYYAITHPHQVTLWGIEDEALYLAHLKAYQEGAARATEAEALLARLRATPSHAALTRRAASCQEGAGSSWRTGMPCASARVASVS